ncbi:hypothetical protein HPB51_006693 [Rhipicephalus microplus]|uniref:Protein FAM50 homolog n=1 Tax=Rhipicephalus microplus TaxID=6941 RepID=A0A9J6E7Z3_RHIMP|nr:hypothetical protein HPB51_006693 [Rhipicephalus microplus]
MAMYKGAASEAGRALHLKKKREKALEELELRKKKIEEELKLSTMENKFAAHYDAVEQQLKSSTIGLVTLDEMKARMRFECTVFSFIQIAALSFKLDDEEEEEEDSEENNNNCEEKEDLPETKKQGEDDKDRDGADYEPPSKRKLGKNPDVDTSFLPDREREEDEKRIREELRMEWVQKQQQLKNEDIEITFSYWDGSGHRKVVRMKKGNSIYQFLQKCLEVLRKDFYELRAVTADQLMYVKEDLIIPHHYTFYDFIVTKQDRCNLRLAVFCTSSAPLARNAVVRSGDGHAWDLRNFLQSGALMSAGRNQTTCRRE